MKSKAYVSLEQFTVTLFHLYPTIYLHKKTRSLEIMFSLLLSQVFELIASGNIAKTGLSKEHPFVKFFNDPSKIENTLSLDDSLFWGSLYIFNNAPDEKVREISTRISKRKLFPMLDVWRIADQVYAENPLLCPNSALERVKKIGAACKSVCGEIVQKSSLWSENFHYDTYDRPIYKPLEKNGGDPQQINVEVGGSIIDIASISPIVASSASFNIHRIYYEEDSVDIAPLSKKLYDMLKSELSK